MDKIKIEKNTKEWLNYGMPDEGVYYAKYNLYDGLVSLHPTDGTNGKTRYFSTSNYGIDITMTMKVEVVDRTSNDKN